MRYFIRLNGALLEVHPLTKPHRTQSAATVRVMRDGTIHRVEWRDVIRSY